MPKVPRYITQIVLPYALFASLWILLSDRLLETLVTDFALRAWLQTYKGLAFVAVTSLLLYGLLRREKAHRERFKIEQERLRNRILGILENISDGFVALDCNWNYQYINRRAGEFLGREPGDLIGKNIWEEFPEGVNQNFYHAYQRVMRTQQPETIEELYPPWQRWFENRISPTPEGLHIFFQEITTRKQAELWREGQSRVLEKIVAEHPLPEVLETLIYTIESQATNALGSVMLLDADGQHLHYSAGPSLPPGLAPAIEGLAIGPAAGACGTAAYTRELVIVEDFLTDPRGADYRALTTQLNLHACWSQPIFSASGQVLGTFAMYYTEVRAPSVSERRLIAEAGHLAAVAIEAARNRSALLASETRFRATFEQAAVGIAHVSPEGKFLRINQKFCDIAGYPLGELLTLSFQDITHPDDLGADMNQVKQVLVGTIDTYSMEKRYRQKNGAFVWANLTVSLVHKDDASPDYLIAVVEDIRERKQAEVAQEQSKQRLRDLIDGLGPSIFVGLLSPEGILIEANRPALEAADLKPEDVLGKPLVESYWINYSETIMQQIQEAITRAARGEASRFDFLARMGENQFALLDFSLQPLLDVDGRVVFLVPSAANITERNRAENMFRASEERLRLALDAAQMGTFDWDIPSNQITWSHWHEVLWGFKPGEFGGTYEAFAARVHPDDLPGINTEVARCISDHAAFVREFRVVWSDQSVHWISARGEFTLSADNQPLRMLGTVIEISNRKRAEAALRQSEEHFRSIFEQAMDGILIADANAQFLDVNNTVCQMLGYTREELLKLSVTDIIGAEELPLLEPALKNLKEQGQVRSEWRLLRRDGSVLLAEVSSKVLTDGRLQGFVRDITEYRKSQASLQEREEILRLFVQHSPAAIGMLDTEMRYVVASRRWLSDYALHDQDIIGRSHYAVFPEISPRWRAIHQRCLAGATERCDEDRLVRADGHIDWVKWEVCPWRKADDSIGGIVIFSEMVTEQKQAALKMAEDAKSLARLSRQLLAAQETERRHIARELHDEVGQLLTVVKLDLQTVLRQEQPQALNTSVREGMESIDRVISRVRDLSLDLRPSMLDDFGLVPALRWLVQRHAKHLETSIDLDLPDNPPRLPTEVETACFRIVQEALTNVLRHAEAKTIHVAMRLYAHNVEITIKDDGKGFDLIASRSAENPGTGFGMLGMRERAELAGGEFDMIAAPGQGCSVIARFPLAPTVDPKGRP